MEITVEQENRGFTLELWSFAPDLFSLGIITPLGEQISPADPRIGATQSVSFILSPSSARIDYEIVEFRSGSQLIQVRVENPPVGIWRFQAVSRRYVNGSFHMWLPITGLGSPAVRFFKSRSGYNPDGSRMQQRNRHGQHVSGLQRRSLSALQQRLRQR